MFEVKTPAKICHPEAPQREKNNILAVSDEEDFQWYIE